MTLRRTELKRGKGLKRRKRLPQMSANKRAKLAAQGIHNPSSTLVSVETPASTGFDAATVDAILERDGWSCVRGGSALWGERGRDWSIQHRRARGIGGTDRPDTNAPQNGIALCGSGTTGCHGWVEAHPIEAEAAGWRVPQGGDPLKFPVKHALHGDGTFLHSNGSRGSQPEEACA